MPLRSTKESDMDREKAAGGITAGLMLIGIGVLAFTDGW
jgi:hypothetical protein